MKKTLTINSTGVDVCVHIDTLIENYFDSKTAKAVLLFFILYIKNIYYLHG